MARNGGLHAGMFVLVRALQGPPARVSVTGEDTEWRDRRRGSRFPRSEPPFLG